MSPANKPQPCTEEQVLEICEKVRRRSERMALRKLPIGLNAEDLFDVGQEAVVKALRIFEPNGQHKDVPVVAYALKASMRAMFRLLKDERRKQIKRRSLVVYNPEGDEIQIHSDKNALDPASIVAARESLSTNGTTISSVHKNRVVTLTEIRSNLPSAVETAKAVERLRTAIFGSINVEDVKEIMARMVRKAKTGDVGATRLILDQITGKAVPVSVKHTVTTDDSELLEMD
jgi:hypothetical protein